MLYERKRHGKANPTLFSSLFCLQSLTKTTAVRRCPSPAARRMRPSSTALSAPPTGSAPPPRPRPSPPRPAPPPPQTRAQRRASRGGAPPSLSLQGVDCPKTCPSVNTGALLPLRFLWQTEERDSLSASVWTALFLIYSWLVCFYVWSVISSVGDAFENAMFSLELMKTKEQAL